MIASPKEGWGGWNWSWSVGLTCTNDDSIGHCGLWHAAPPLHSAFRTTCLGHNWRVPRGGSDWKWDVTPFQLGQYMHARQAFRRPKLVEFGDECACVAFCSCTCV